jgi:tetratricopeptide (TPR) repeat protein
MNKKNEALVLYDTVYKSYKNSDNLNIHEDVLWAVSLKMELLKEIGKFGEQIKIADKVVKKFRKSNNISTLLKIFEVMFEKAKTLYYQGKWYKEINVYNNIIKWFNNTNSPPCIKIEIIRAMQYKAVSLQQMGVLNKAIQVYDEAIKICAESEDKDNFKIIYLLVKKAELLAYFGDYDGYEKIYKDIYCENINSNDAEIRGIIVKMMFNRAFFEGMRDNFLDKIQLYKEIIRLFGDDTDIEVVEVVTNAIFKLGIMLGNDEKWDEAIQVYTIIKEYANYSDDTIQSRIAAALSNRIVCLGIMGNKSEEIRAYEEFIEMFKSSGDDEIKKMISIAQSELAERKQNPEDGTNP